jgi:peptidoglycan/LPS O-acetylase OafA/YrhL
MGIVRLFLAWVVAADHWRTFAVDRGSSAIDDHYKLGFNAGYAVFFFYVISGFLITYTLTRNYDRDLPGTLAFYRRRFIRIFSLYWPLVIIALLMVPYAWTWFSSASPLDLWTNVFLIGMDWSIPFASYPAPHNAAAVNGLGQAWTLGAELTFYLMAPALMRSWRIGAALLVASLAVRWTFVITLGPGAHTVWTYWFFPSSVCFFMLGHLACLAGFRWPLLLRPALALPAILGSLAIMTFGPYQDFDGPRFWLSLVLFVLGLPGLFELTKQVAWMNLMGDLSYPLYLSHGIVLIVAAPLLAGLVPFGPYASTVLWISAATAVSLIVHRLIEIPTAAAMGHIGAKAAVRT